MDAAPSNTSSNNVEPINLDMSKTEKKIVTMVVDDDRSMRMMLKFQLEDMGHTIIEAEDGLDAWQKLQEAKDKVDLVVLDREMPKMNGLEVVAQMKDNHALRNIPIIMQTGSDGAEQIKEGIDAGVFYYLTKPIEEEVLRSVVTAAARNVKQQKQLGVELKKHRSSFNLIRDCHFVFSSIEEAESISCFIANCFPEPERVVTGIAELLVNAVEHGNLGIGYEEKSWLLKSGTWREEVTRRTSFPEHKEKYIEAWYMATSNGVKFRVRDMGDGFDWKKYMSVDPSRAQETHGRGIAQACSSCFDSLEYNDVGNEVTAYVQNERSIDW